MWRPITFTMKGQKQVKVLSAVGEESVGRADTRIWSWRLTSESVSVILSQASMFRQPVSTWFEPWMANNGTSFSMMLYFYSCKMMSNSLYPWLIYMLLICSLISICSFLQQQEWPRALWSRFPFSVCFTLPNFHKYHVPSFLNWSWLTFWSIWIILIPLFLSLNLMGRQLALKYGTNLLVHPLRVICRCEMRCSTS